MGLFKLYLELKPLKQVHFELPVQHCLASHSLHGKRGECVNEITLSLVLFSVQLNDLRNTSDLSLSTIEAPKILLFFFFIHTSKSPDSHVHFQEKLSV